MNNTNKIIFGVVIVVVIVALTTFFARAKITTAEHFGAMNRDANGTVFYSPSQYSAAPTPRFGNIDLNSALHYPVSNSTGGMSAVPATPLEGCTNCGGDDNNQDVVLPSGDGESIVIDRLVFANRNSQLRAMGDPIRGDLPIVPGAPGWFRTSVAPQIDLQRGALNYLGGENGATQKMDNLFAQSQAGLLPSSRIDNSLSSVSGSTYAHLGNRGQDLIVTSSL